VDEDLREEIKKTELLAVISLILKTKFSCLNKV
jgi:hypothetical protein